MRSADPLILGAGPAGCAAAIALAQGGALPLLLDRSAEVGDPLCGGFMSWRTLAQLDAIGVQLDDLGGHGVSELRLFAQGRQASVPLPEPALGLSRHALDSRLREAALAAGARLEVDTIRALEPGVARGQRRDWHAESLFLATGKHDVRGHSRPRASGDPALGLRLRLPASPEREALLDGAIELHLFDGGYVGIVLQEKGSANVCMAVRKSALARCCGDPVALVERLGNHSPALAARLGGDWQDARIESIGAVPYGHVAGQSEPGLFQLGDQAAVIPSLAGEGMAIAVASGTLAAHHWLGSGAAAAPAYQREFATRAARPIRLAGLGWRAAESRLGSRAAVALARIAPGFVRQFAEMARIPPPASLARP